MLFVFIFLLLEKAAIFHLTNLNMECFLDRFLEEMLLFVASDATGALTGFYVIERRCIGSGVRPGGGGSRESQSRHVFQCAGQV